MFGSYTPLPQSPGEDTKPQHAPSPTRYFLTYHLLLILTICIVFLFTLTAVLILPITGLDLGLSILGQVRCPCPRSLTHSEPYKLSSFRENPLDASPSSLSSSSHKDYKDQNQDKDYNHNNPHNHAWTSKVIPSTTGGGLFVSHADDVTEALVNVVDPERTHSGPRNRSYGIAMFHQLHCLGSLRDGLFGAHSGAPDALGGRTAEETDHLEHCFNYILQSIICAASDTIERPKHIIPDGEQPMWHVDGMGDVHRCKDAGVLWEMSERSLEEPVDMRKWKGEGVGVREFFRLGEDYG